MGKKSPSAPPAPDPVATANAQAGANKDAILESARVNQITQQSPFGVVRYTGAIGGPDRTQVTELHSVDQANLDRQRALATALTGQAVQRAGQLPSSPFTLDGLPQIDQNYARGIQDRVYQGFADKIGEQYGRDAEALRTQLVNQGINVGNEAYARAEQDLMGNRDRALRDAYTASLTEGRNQLAVDQNVRNQAISDLLLQRSQPINELSAYLQGAPALNAPQAPQAAQYQVSPADITGTTYSNYQGALNNYNQKLGTQNSKMGAGAGLAGAIGGAAIASSKEFKEQKQPIDRRKILEGVTALSVERWRYKGDKAEHIGCYAEDFNNEFGFDPKPFIYTADAVGVCMAAIQELAAQNTALQDRMNRLEGARYAAD